MQYHFSKSFNSMKPSALRESFKLASQPGVISFAAGSPSPDAFPIFELREIFNNIFSNKTVAAKALGYGVTEGLPQLRELLKAQMKSRLGEDIAEENDLIITSGGQQGIELSAKVFLNRDDTILCENPTFSNSLNSFRGLGARIMGVPLLCDGMDLERLQEALKSEGHPKLIYCISSFQNPSGYTTSAEKRKQIYELACRYDAIIIEDDPYYDLRYSGEDVAPIKALDTQGRVIYTSTFSKTVAPGIRLGFAVANREIIQKMVIAKQGEDVHPNMPLQMAVYSYLTEYDFEKHIQDIRSLYRKKRDAMLSCLEEKLQGKLAWSKPDGGLFIWCTLPENGDADQFALEALKNKLLVSVGSGFTIGNEGPCPSFRLSFSMPSFENIEKGVEILAKTYEEFYRV